MGLFQLRNFHTCDDNDGDELDTTDVDKRVVDTTEVDFMGEETCTVLDVTEETTTDEEHGISFVVDSF